MSLIWSKNWNCVYWQLQFQLKVNLGTPTLVSPKSIYWCQKQPPSTPVTVNVILIQICSYYRRVVLTYLSVNNYVLGCGFNSEQFRYFPFLHFGSFRLREKRITARKMKFLLRISSVNVTKSADLITFTEKILNGKLLFLYSELFRNDHFL